MTALTVSARPGTELRPVPWQAMLWVTWRQHRGLVISAVTAFIAAVTGMLIEGTKIHHDYAIMTACHPVLSPACQQLSGYFYSTDWHLGNGIRVAVQAAPALIAIFAGPPLVARELETNTFQYAWTQGIGRVRWTVTKFVILGSALTIAALALSQLFAWFFDPFLNTESMSNLTVAVFDTRGAVYAVWCLVAFALGAFLGALLRRILPAMAAALGGYVGLTALTWFYLRDRYPVSTFWPMQIFEGGWLLVLCAALVAGTIRLVRHHAA